MSVKIRLSRVGKKHAPYYRIVAVDSRKKRDGAFLEDLGTYNPISHELIQFNAEGIDKWISKGAQPSLVVQRLHKLYKKQQKASTAA